jgi:hypothetical protein
MAQDGINDAVVSMTPQDVLLLRRMLKDYLNGRFNTVNRPAVDEPDPIAPEVYVALTPSGGIPALGGSGTDVDAVATNCEIYRLLPSNGTDPGSGLQDAGFTKPIYNLYGAWGGNSWVVVKRDKWGTWWTDPKSSTGTGFSDGVLGDVQFADGAGGFLNANDAAVDLGIAGALDRMTADADTVTAYISTTLGALVILQASSSGTNGNALTVQDSPENNNHFQIICKDVTHGYCGINVGGSSGNDTFTLKSKQFTMSAGVLTLTTSTGIAGTVTQINNGFGLLLSDIASSGSVSICYNSAGTFIGAKFADAGGSYVVTLSDGVSGNAITVNNGDIYLPGSSGNTYKWGTNTGAPGAETFITLPLSAYGSDSLHLMGGPADWILVNVNGTNRKIPVY